MNSPHPFPGNEDRPIVYVRRVEVSDLPDDVQRELEGTRPVYAIHHEEGERMALVTDRSLAFVLARQHDFEPVSVH